MLIKPEDIIAELSVEDLCLTAERYFSCITDPTPQLAKPFSNFAEASSLLKNMSYLLSGLHLGKTMTILDFGAGTCWFSRFLNQLDCKTISCDVSKTALDLGKRLFKELPVIGKHLYEPEFLLFDGHEIDLPDESVDRIVCLDSFHHVPNQEQVISELARVLRTGGIAGFAEPGRFHSRADQSQYEMKNYKVLENDIDVVKVFEIAQNHGFTDIKLELLCDMKVSLEQHRKLTSGDIGPNLRERIRENLGNQMNNFSVFFLYKGQFISDSRNSQGLSHTIRTEKSYYEVSKGEQLEIELDISNTGSARWLVNNEHDIGIVKIGTHLYDKDNNLINLDFSRHLFERPVKRGETRKKTISVSFQREGIFNLKVDLVSEAICWFENVGSQPQSIKVKVT